jgi:hypothetical protein
MPGAADARIGAGEPRCEGVLQKVENPTGGRRFSTFRAVTVQIVENPAGGG